MSNKTQLQSNNETLDSILSNVLGLPSQESLKHGAYVWKKYEDHVPATTLSFTQLTSGIAPMLVQVSSSDPNVDLSKVDSSFFVGLKTKTSSSSTNIITFISENQISLGAEGSTNPSVFDYTYNPETAQLSFTTIKWTSVTWDSCTRNEEKGTFVDFVVSDQSTAYPDGGEQGGYWYEKVVEGIPSPAGFTKVTVDTFTPTSNQRLDTTTIEHSHGSIPTLCVVIGNPLTTSDVPLQVGAINGSKKYGIMLGEGTGYWRAGAVLTANNFRFSESYGFNFIAGVEYTVICMS